jgi:hypothetical protein
MPSRASIRLGDAMLTTFEVVGFSLLVIVLLPVAIISLATGSKPPKSVRIRESYMALGIVSVRFAFNYVEDDRILKCYHIEPYLRFVSDLFLLTLCIIFATQLAMHFGFVEADLGEKIKVWCAGPFFALFFIYGLILARGLQRLRNAERG